MQLLENATCPYLPASFKMEQAWESLKHSNEPGQPGQLFVEGTLKSKLLPRVGQKTTNREVHPWKLNGLKYFIIWTWMKFNQNTQTNLCWIQVELKLDHLKTYVVTPQSVSPETKWHIKRRRICKTLCIIGCNHKFC